jgi:hypothetical protein
MENIKMEVKGTILTMVIDLSKRGKVSASGKSTMIASTSGNVTIPGTNLKIGVNAYEPVN